MLKKAGNKTDCMQDFTANAFRCNFISNPLQISAVGALAGWLPRTSRHIFASCLEQTDRAEAIGLFFTHYRGLKVWPVTLNERLGRSISIYRSVNYLFSSNISKAILDSVAKIYDNHSDWVPKLSVAQLKISACQG